MGPGGIVGPGGIIGPGEIPGPCKVIGAKHAGVYMLEIMGATRGDNIGGWVLGTACVLVTGVVTSVVFIGGAICALDIISRPSATFELQPSPKTAFPF